MFLSLSDIVILIGIGIIAFFAAGAFAPFEALGWWAGWFGNKEKLRTTLEVGRISAPDRENNKADIFFVYLPGIGSISGDIHKDDENALLDFLSASLKNTVIVDDVFPYSVDNRALTGQRFFAWFWKWLYNLRLRGEKILSFLINIRNLYQVAVSADGRYGPIYNYGSADIILRGLMRKGYSVGSGKPVVILGHSGGGQIAVGAALYLKPVLRAPIYVISLAGILTSDPGLLSLEHLYHLYGKKDYIQKIASLLSLGRWYIIPHSHWNKLRKQGKITKICVGPMKHAYMRGYLDRKSYLPDGKSYLLRTANVLSDIVNNKIYSKTVSC